ncbi:hypothetical protein [Bacillus sp. FJAT-29814]|uniref:hypothetical protein n=1 Tax=Bacillus sp. FJAT-29814 TaxID=1729688 RepID=UPI0008358FBB|nr:hypothetical protein [Bacillus sp. FJAT-29814]
MAIGKCFKCGKERELLTTTSTKIENERSYSFSVQEHSKCCRNCLDIAMWSSLIIDDYRRFDMWKQFAQSKGYDWKLLEFKPTYPKIISVKDRIYKNNEYEHEYIQIGFRMNGTEFTGAVHVYKGYVNGMTLLNMECGNKKYTYPYNEKLLKLTEKQLIPKLKNKITPYIMGESGKNRE